MGKAARRAEDVPKRAVAEVLASTSQVTSGKCLATREGGACCQAAGGK